jgi:hypothetical protein
MVLYKAGYGMMPPAARKGKLTSKLLRVNRDDFVKKPILAAAVAPAYSKLTLGHPPAANTTWLFYKIM